MDSDSELQPTPQQWETKCLADTLQGMTVTLHQLAFNNLR